MLVVSSFDLLFIAGALAVDGIGYAAWIVYAMVYRCVGLILMDS